MVQQQMGQGCIPAWGLGTGQGLVGLGSPIKGLVKLKNTSPVEKHKCFFIYNFLLVASDYTVD